jgi:hypothetical protein
MIANVCKSYSITTLLNLRVHKQKRTTAKCVCLAAEGSLRHLWPSHVTTSSLLCGWVRQIMSAESSSRVVVDTGVGVGDDAQKGGSPALEGKTDGPIKPTSGTELDNAPPVTFLQLFKCVLSVGCGVWGPMLGRPCVHCCCVCFLGVGHLFVLALEWATPVTCAGEASVQIDALFRVLCVFCAQRPGSMRPPTSHTAVFPEFCSGPMGYPLPVSGNPACP